MENNKQNTVLLTIIAVATLLVAVVGATFAYFTANQSTGSTALVLTKTGKMNITFADGTDAIVADKQSGFQPSPNLLVDKTFTITGENITKTNSVVVDAAGVKTPGAEASLTMPFIVSLDYTTTFINNELHVLIKQVGTTDLVQKLKYTGTVLEDSTAPAELKGIAGLAGYYDNTVGTGTVDSKETTASKELVYGEFLDTSSNDGSNNKITFRVVMVFPDNKENQDSNKNATFSGILKVTTTENGAPRA